ncbi:MAG TPA: chemotaxis protein CheR [Verrucomicrobia bacterium]|nr:MAG: hypothetical protein A2X46_12265 [Lentisphaerae bacterium GWF2_57_35]HBA84065.1 chemotaxis protein CheR [Verrucomicrobiota bacterium]
MTISQHEFDLFREFIQRHCGIHLGDDKTYLIESRLAHLVAEAGCQDFQEFYVKTKNDPTGELRDRIVDAITTNETLWFRDGKPWVALREAIIPGWVKELREGRKNKIRIWSAASSTGQEAYSLAMAIDMLLGPMPSPETLPASFEIVGTDISPSVLFLAIAGRYNQIEISRGLDEYHRLKYFTKQGPIWILNEALRKRVTFKKFNLQDSLAPLGHFDLVLCRNVAIYFSDVFKRELFARIARALNPGGYLFVGAAESLTGHSTAFKMLEYKDAIYYRKAGEP